MLKQMDMLEAATGHARRGEAEQARAIWQDLIDDGGENGDFARVDLAEHLFADGQETAARAQLAALKATRRTNSGGWNGAAELLEERGELAEALVWYTMAIERFTPTDVDALDRPMSWPAMLVRARRRVRQRVGLPPDETDLSILTEDEIRAMFRRPMPTTTRWMRYATTRAGSPRYGCSSGRAATSPPRGTVPRTHRRGREPARVLRRPGVEADRDRRRGWPSHQHRVMHRRQFWRVPRH